MKLVELKARVEADVVYATLHGEIDLAAIPALREQLPSLLDNQMLALVLDLADVDYLDSGGIHLLHRLRSELQERNQRLVLVVSPGSVVSHALRMSGVEWSSDIVPSPDAARELAGRKTDR